MKSVFQLMGIYYQPHHVFSNLKPKRQWLLPLAVSILATIVATSIIYPSFILPETTEKITNNPSLSSEQAEKTLSQLRSPVTIVLNTVSGIINLPVFLLAICAVYWGIFIMLECKIHFASVFTAAAYGTLVNIPVLAVKIPLMFINDTSHVYTSPAIFYPESIKLGFWLRVLSNFDVATIWFLLVMSIGITVLGKISPKKTYTVIFTVWLVWVLISSLLVNVLPF